MIGIGWEERTREWLFDNERSQAWLARKAGCTVFHLNGCLQGKRQASEKLLRQLERVMAIPYGTLLRNGARAAS